MFCLLTRKGVRLLARQRVIFCKELQERGSKGDKTSSPRQDAPEIELQASAIVVIRQHVFLMMAKEW
jgi:hypothetical protein